MSFVQPAFPVFLLVVFGVYWALRDVRAQNGWLVAASAVFYGWVHPWFLLLMYGSAVIDFTLGLLVARRPEWGRAAVVASVTANLGLLAYFKYAGFFVTNLVAALAALGIDADVRIISIVLPVGISFYTFQTMGYTIDVARGELEARTRFVDYVLYVSFFAQLVAGPIERAGRLLPQIEQPRALTLERIQSGIALALWGGFKKLVVADSLAPYVDKVFVLESPAPVLVWAASFAFMIQIYADFSGYTDIARGSARLLGFDLTLNFREPFLARTTIEFWQRWHMSLSTWLRDYVLGPLVGDGGAGRLRFGLATLATFVLIGFWHGPSWNFVMFGLFHGTLVILYGLAARRLPPRGSAPWLDAALITVHLGLVGLTGSLLFRETHVDRLLAHLTQWPWTGTADDLVAAMVIVGVTLLGCVPLLVQWAVVTRVVPRIAASPWFLPLQTTTWAGLLAAMFLFYRTTLQDFVYFQF
ncbi:MAG: MBOAT family O-acyltransferase [Myxococcota bacterium]